MALGLPGVPPLFNGKLMTPQNKKIALLFPGQGSQFPGMGKSLFDNFSQAREIFEQANAAMGFNLAEKIFSGTEEELKQTHITQPAIFTVSSAVINVLNSLHPEIMSQSAFTAGHSLGEYSAFFAAGAFDFQTGIKLVKCRGEFIQDCSKKYPGTMVAVIGVSKEELHKLCGECSSGNDFCELVNFNCPGQIVVAGTIAGCETLAGKIAQAQGGKAIRLNVSGAFHSKLMNEASRKMAELLTQTQISDSKIPVLTNLDALATMKQNEIKDKLTQQIDHPVLWEVSIQRMIQEGVETFIECGPGKVLSGLLRKIDRKKKVLNIEDEESLKKTVQSLMEVVPG